MNEISKAAAKADIVEAAEDHARDLNKRADDLEKYDVWPKTQASFLLEPFNVRVLSLLILCTRRLRLFSAPVPILSTVIFLSSVL